MPLKLLLSCREECCCYCYIYLYYFRVLCGVTYTNLFNTHLRLNHKNENSQADVTLCPHIFTNTPHLSILIMR